MNAVRHWGLSGEEVSILLSLGLQGSLPKDKCGSGLSQLGMGKMLGNVRRSAQS